MKLKTFILSAIALIGMATPAFAKGKAAKNTDNNVSSDTETVAEHDMNVYGANYTDGDKFDGLTRKVGFDRMIPPHALEVAYEKTTHIIFPSEVVYVDLGNENLVAGLADGAKNVLRVKSAFKSFKTETNLSVITEDGSYYSFNVKFAKEPLLLNIEMTDFLHDGEAVNRPNNAQEIYLEKLGQFAGLVKHGSVDIAYRVDKPLHVVVAHRHRLVFCLAEVVTVLKCGILIHQRIEHRFGLVNKQQVLYDRDITPLAAPSYRHHHLCHRSEHFKSC